MVLRLQELEQVHRSHAASLEAEVQAATQTLLQQQHHLARTERLAAVGELSAKLAHELRNPLAGMQLTLLNLRQDLQDPDVIDRLDLVIAELERITQLLNSLLAQARPVPERPRLVDLAKEIRELLALLQYQAMPAIVLEAAVPEHLQCRLPAGQLRQALLNLILNAIQALAGNRGKVRIRAEKQADLLQLSVCDDGPGFPEFLLTRGVKTFISGRESGIGLGLAMVSRFAREVGGKLELTNREPQGACATLLLPWEEGDG
jgi:signal transduction histidine kinase